jgi:hypothetical protein
MTSASTVSQNIREAAEDTHEGVREIGKSVARKTRVRTKVSKKSPKIEPKILLKADSVTLAVEAEKEAGTLPNASSFCVTPFVSHRCPHGHPDFMAT